MEKTFPCKKDSWIVWFLVVVYAFVFGVVYWSPSNEEVPFWVSLLLVGSVLFTYWLYIDTVTRVEGNKLIQKSGPMKWTILISDIKKIKKQGTHMINHGTWSMDKMDIIHRKGTLSISPADKEVLIKVLKNINPNIELI